jgi:Pentapeptide repeats (8 copies)
MSGAILHETQLSRSLLSGADLREADLRGADLSKSNLSWATLSEANLSDANLADAILSEANLSDANLRGANLRGANLRGAHISEYEKDLLRSINVEGLDEARVKSKSESKTIEQGPKPKSGGSDSSSTLRIRITEEPLIARNLATIIATLVELHTKSWLIQQGRFKDFGEYVQTKDPRFEEEANLLIEELTYNSPIEIKFNVDLDPRSVVEAMKIGLDAILQRQHRLKAAELVNLDKELDVKKKALELEKKHIEMIQYVFEVASQMIDMLRPGVDAITKATLVKGLVPTLLQLANISTELEIILSVTQGKMVREEEAQHIPSGSTAFLP